MAKITTRAGLIVGTELIIDEPGRTIGLAVAGNLVAKDGVTMQALYSKLVDLWATATYQDSPFPMNAIDALSGQYQIGIDAGGNANGWKFLNQNTRDYLRDGGVEEYNASGVLARVQVCAIGLGAVSAGSQLYYQTAIGGPAVNFVYTDQVNQMIQVYGDAVADPTTTTFDTRTYLKGYVRSEGKKYKDSDLGETGKSNTGAYIVNLLLSNETDLKIQDTDANVATILPYTGITITYLSGTGFTVATVETLVIDDVRQDTDAAGVADYTANGGTAVLAAFTGEREVGTGTYYPFTKIVAGNAASLEDIYTKIQYQLRQGTDIDAGAGSVIGKTADSLAAFVGDTLETTLGVYVDNIQAADANRIVFNDQNAIDRINPVVSAGTLNFNSIMVGAGSSYRLIFTTGPGAGDDYGEAGAITVKDNSGVDITGVISAGSISFDFDYTNDTLGGTAGTSKPVTLVGVRPGFSKFAVAIGTLTNSKTIALSLVAETDRAYV